MATISPLAEFLETALDWANRNDREIKLALKDSVTRDENLVVKVQFRDAFGTYESEEILPIYRQIRRGRRKRDEDEADTLEAYEARVFTLIDRACVRARKARISYWAKSDPRQVTLIAKSR
jgi:hypothetical protein